MSEAAILVAKDLVKEHGSGPVKVRALKGVSLELKPGELTLLMGPSGSGKTTLLSILGCILTQSSGHLTINGQSTDGMTPEELAKLRRRSIGFVFQSYNLFPTLTAVENVRLALDVRGHSGQKAKEMAVAALEAVGLGHRINAYPRTMSGGEQQRVAIARSLAGSPPLIFADEPTAALDSENGLAVMALIQELARDKSRAVLAVTHDHRTLQFADRILSIEDGVLVDDKHQKAEKAPPPKRKKDQPAKTGTKKA